MKSNLTFSSKSGNNYFYNKENNEFFLIHPAFKYILGQKDKNIDIDKWFADLPENIIIKGYGGFSKSTIQYYYFKYRFFEESKRIEKFKPNDSLGLSVYPEQIQTEFKNCELIAFEVTEKCNLNCIYCTYSENFSWFDKRQNKSLSFKTAKTFLDYFFDNSETNSHTSNKNVNISFYGGEPLLNFGLVKEILNYAKNLKIKKIKLSFSMTTNALLLEKYADFLVENDFELTISLDGNEVHNSYRVFHNGESAYQKIMDNILFLKNNFPDYFKNKVSFNSVLHNKNSVSEMYSFFLKTFKQTPLITEFNYEGVRENKKDSFLKLYRNFNESLIRSENYALIEREKLLEVPKDKDFRYFMDQTKFVIKTYSNLINGTQQQLITSTCIAFSLRLFVTVNGKIFPCENINHKYFLGRVTDSGVELNFEEIAAQYNKYYKRMKSQCFNCYFSTSCDQCMFYMDMDSEAPACEGFTNKDSDYKKFLASRIQLIENEPKKYGAFFKKKKINR